MDWKYDHTYVAAGWFDPLMKVEGWFDDEAAATEGAPPAPAPAAVVRGKYFVANIGRLMR